MHHKVLQQFRVVSQNLAHSHDHSSAVEIIGVLKACHKRLSSKPCSPYTGCVAPHKVQVGLIALAQLLPHLVEVATIHRVLKGAAVAVLQHQPGLCLGVLGAVLGLVLQNPSPSQSGYLWPCRFGSSYQCELLAALQALPGVEVHVLNVRTLGQNKVVHAGWMPSLASGCMLTRG